MSFESFWYSRAFFGKIRKTDQKDFFDFSQKSSKIPKWPETCEGVKFNLHFHTFLWNNENPKNRISLSWGLKKRITEKIKQGVYQSLLSEKQDFLKGWWRRCFLRYRANRIQNAVQGQQLELPKILNTALNRNI